MAKPILTAKVGTNADLFPDITAQITHAVQGKTIDRVEIDSTGMNSYLEFWFTDGSVLRFEYNWIYDFEIETLLDRSS